MTILSVFFEVISPKHTRACSSLKRPSRSLQTAWHAVCRLHGAVCRLREVSRLHGTYTSYLHIHNMCLTYQHIVRTLEQFLTIYFAGSGVVHTDVIVSMVTYTYIRSIPKLHWPPGFTICFWCFPDFV